MKIHDLARDICLNGQPYPLLHYNYLSRSDISYKCNLMFEP